MDCPLGKSLLVTPVPCQVIVQPPHCLPMLSAPSPATRTCAGGAVNFSTVRATPAQLAAPRPDAQERRAARSDRREAVRRDDLRPTGERVTSHATRDGPNHPDDRRESVPRVPAAG